MLCFNVYFCGLKEYTDNQSNQPKAFISSCVHYLLFNFRQEQKKKKQKRQEKI